MDGETSQRPASRVCGYFTPGEAAGLVSLPLELLTSDFFESGDAAGLVLSPVFLSSVFLSSAAGDADGLAEGDDCGLGTVFGALTGLVSGVVVHAAIPNAVIAKIVNRIDLLICTSMC